MANKKIIQFNKTKCKNLSIVTIEKIIKILVHLLILLSLQIK